LIHHFPVIFVVSFAFCEAQASPSTNKAYLALVESLSLGMLLKLHTDIPTCLFEMASVPIIELNAGFDILLPLWDAEELEKGPSQFDGEIPAPARGLYLMSTLLYPFN
jgi:hypothetical protein